MVIARNDLARHGARRHPHGGFARRRASAAAIVAYAVFGPVDVVGVARTERILDVAVVLRALIDVFDHQRDGRPRRDLTAIVVGEDAREDFDRVRLLPLGGEAGGSGTALVQIDLDVGLGQRNARRAAVDDAADGRSMAFAPGGDTEHMAESVVGHGGIQVWRRFSGWL